MIPSEAKPGERGTHDDAEEDVPPVVSEVRVAGRRDIDGGAERNECKHQEVSRRRGGLVTKLNGSRRAVRLLLRRMRRSPQVRERDILALAVGRVIAAAVASTSKKGTGRVVWVESSWSKEGNGNGKLGTQKQGQVNQAGGGD